MKNGYFFFLLFSSFSLQAATGPCSEAVLTSKELRVETIKKCVDLMGPYLTPYFLSIGLAHAVKNGNIENTKEWIKHGAHPDMPKNICTFPLAIETCNLEIIDELLKAGANFKLSCPASADEKSVTGLRAQDVIEKNVIISCMSDTQGSDDLCDKWRAFEEEMGQLLKRHGWIRVR